MAFRLFTTLLVSLLLFSPAAHSSPVVRPRTFRRSTSTAQCANPPASQVAASLFDNGASNEPAFQAVDSQSTAAPCPLGATISDSTEVSERSSCPWEYEVDVNPDRFPRAIAQARSRCDKCIGPSGAEISNAVCEPVIYPLKVLNRTTCDDGTYTYEVVIEDITVAFSCRRPVTSR